MKRRETEQLIVAFDYGFMTQKNADTFPILNCRDSRYGQIGATSCGRKGPTANSVSFPVGFIDDFFFAESFGKWDNEQRTKSHQDTVTQACAGVVLVPQGPPKGDLMANGRVEMAVREVERQ